MSLSIGMHKTQPYHSNSPFPCQRSMINSVEAIAQIILKRSVLMHKHLW